MNFRVWDVTEKCWIPPVDCAINSNGNLLTYDTKSDRWALETIEHVISRKTGLKDDSGKEIFEGDICRILADNGAFRGGKTKHLAEVCWDSEDTGFFYATTSEFYPHVKPWFAVSVEVIGNIFENPELRDKV